MTIKKCISIILLSAFIFFDCSDEPTSIGSGLLGEKINLITINSDSLPINQASSYFHLQNVRLGASASLLLGKTENSDTASILIKFDAGLVDSVKGAILNDSITVTSAVMELQQTYSFGEATAPFDFTVHKVLSNWSVDFNEDSLLGLQYDPEDSKLNEHGISDSLTSITLNIQLLQEWLNIIADTSLNGNYGVYIKPTDNTQKVLGYQAITQTFTNIPVIKVVIEKTGDYTDTITFSSTLDLTVMRGSIPPVSSGNIPIRASFVINGKLFFDLSPLPENIVVNKAELILTVDTLETKVGSSYTNQLQAYFLFDSLNTDSVSSSSVTLLRSGNTFSGNITNYIRAWLENNNHGLILTAGNPISGVELFVIKGSDAVLNKPLLKITYTELK